MRTQHFAPHHVRVLQGEQGRADQSNSTYHPPALPEESIFLLTQFNPRTNTLAKDSARGTFGYQVLQL